MQEIEQIKELLDKIEKCNTSSSGKIGIAITEHNRYDMFKKSYEEIKKRLPINSVLVVVDDASTKQVPEADFRFDKNVGIAKAKNKCLELLYLQGCEHFFLFDSDTYPLVDNWFEPYINSSEPHLMYIFENFVKGGLSDTKLVYKDSNKVAYSHPRGCMLYFHRSCLDAVGGMYEGFAKWGYEHPDLSNRIFNAGLTSFRFQDVVNSKGLFYADDEVNSNKNSSVNARERSTIANQMKPLYESRMFNKEFIPFIEKENILVTWYGTKVQDPQRKEHFEADIKHLDSLIKSVKNLNQKLVILHDCFDDVKDCKNIYWVKVETSLNPYIQRWVSYREYLMNNKDKISNLFFIDGTDVEVIVEPRWNDLKDYLWCGDELELVNCNWLTKNHNTATLNNFYKEYGNYQLLNAGVVGGSTDTMLEFTKQLIDFYSLELNIGQTDMAMFNYICRTNWNDKIKSGRQVTTIFKGNENNNISWFKHK